MTPEEMEDAIIAAGCGILRSRIHHIPDGSVVIIQPATPEACKAVTNAAVRMGEIGQDRDVRFVILPPGLDVGTENHAAASEREACAALLDARIAEIRFSRAAALNRDENASLFYEQECLTRLAKAIRNRGP